MTPNKEKVTDLFNRYYNKTATEAEQKELFRLIDTVENEELSVLMANAFNSLQVADFIADDNSADEGLHKIFGTQAPVKAAPVKRMFPLWSKIAVAASILFLFSYLIYSAANKEVKQQGAIAKTTPVKDAAPGSSKATLTLADGTTILLDDAGKGELAKQGNVVVKKTADGQLVYTFQQADATAGVVSINTITTPRGGQYQVVLPDGTNAWLNAASSLSFPTAFNSSIREVTMTGEVYFEVAKKEIPFFVNAAKGTVQVLGTHFNVMAYHDEQTMEATLLEGSIKLSSGDASRLIKPGQQAQINQAGNIKLENGIDVDEVMAWRTGLFNFKDAEVESVMRQLSRWYDVDISYEGKMPHRQITGKLSRNVKLSEVLSMLTYTGVNAKTDGKTIIVAP